MLASDAGIMAMLADGRLRVDPYEPALIQPASLDVRLDRYFRVFANHRYLAIDPREPQPELTDLVEVPAGQPFVLHPGEFVLGSLLEEVALDNTVAARIEGKSGLGRLGLLVHSTAGFIDPGFTGWITLELANVATLPILLWPGMKIGQLCLFELSSPSLRPYGDPAYGSHYQHQGRGPHPSQIWQRFRSWAIPDDQRSTGKIVG